MINRKRLSRLMALMEGEVVYPNRNLNVELSQLLQPFALPADWAEQSHGFFDLVLRQMASATDTQMRSSEVLRPGAGRGG